LVDWAEAKLFHMAVDHFWAGGADEHIQAENEQAEVVGHTEYGQSIGYEVQW